MKLKTLLSTLTGNVLEYVDFMLFAHFMGIFGPIFFPNLNSSQSSILTLSLLAIGFLTRPLGAILFGNLGDGAGRRKALSRSVLMIALPTLFIGLMPSYQTIGITAPICLLLCRAVQGLSVGGEYCNAGIFLMENCPPNRRNFYSSLLSASGSVGSLLALIGFYLVIHSSNPNTYWRIPFILTALGGLVTYLWRISTIESKEFTQSKNTNNDWFKVLSNLPALALTMSTGALTSVLIWIPQTYTNHYVTSTLKWSAKDSVPLVTLALIAHFTLSPIFGLINDRIGYRRGMKIGAVLAGISAYPLFYFLPSHAHYCQIGFMAIASFFGASVHASMIELYPVNERCRGISLGFMLGSCFGGTAPAICALFVFVFNDQSAPSYYIIFLVLVWFVTQHIQQLNLLRPKLVST